MHVLLINILTMVSIQRTSHQMVKESKVIVLWDNNHVLKDCITQKMAKNKSSDRERK